MDERTLLQIRKAISEGKIAAPADGDLPVMLGLQNEDGFPHQGNDQLRQQPGKLHDGKHHDARRVREPQADSRRPRCPARRERRRCSRRGKCRLARRRGIAARTLRRFVPRLFSPGMFVRIRLPIGQPHKALLIIDRAIQSDQGLKYVYVVDAQNKVQTRSIKTGPCRKTASAWWRGNQAGRLGRRGRDPASARTNGSQAGPKADAVACRAIRGRAAGGRQAKRSRKQVRLRRDCMTVAPTLQRKPTPQKD